MTKTTSNLPKEIQNYLDFINSASETNVNTVTKSRIDKNFDKFGEAMNTFLAYPDKLVDIITPAESTFNLFFVQRIVLRVMARHRQSYHTFTRGFSKSFLAFLSRYIHTMLIPRHYSFVVSGTKKQAAQIAKEKVTMDLWQKFPLFEQEMQKVRVGGKLRQAYIQGTDYAEFRFTHGGQLDVVGSGSSTRGGRRHSGIFEEVIEHNGQEINEVILPLMNKQRTTALGVVNPKEPHGSKTFITTAGYIGTYAYEKLIETLCYSVIEPDKYMVMGGSYEIPLMHGLLDANAIMEVISSPSYDRDSMDREYRSIWSGNQTGAAFSANNITDLRKVVRAETRANELKEGEFYAVAADMAKDGTANTAVVVYKIIPKEYAYLYTTVNMFQINHSNYEVVSAILKRTILDYDARLFVYDANGIGAALRDWLNKEQTDYKNGMILPAFGIINPPNAKVKSELRRVSKDREICYEIKASGETGGAINKIFFSKMSSKHIRFLIRKDEALQRFSKLKSFQTATRNRQKQRLRPYLFMDKLEEEMRNLDIKDLSDNRNPNLLQVIRRNKKIEKDFYSATSYGVYGIHEYFEIPYYKRKTKKKSSMADYIMKF